MRYQFGRIGIVLGLLLVGLLGACDDSTNLSAKEFLQRATAHYEKGALPAAIIELKNALNKDPNNAAARLLLGKVYLDYGDSASAEKELQRARELGADRNALVEPLGRTWLLRKKYSDVLDQIQVDESISPADQVMHLVLRGNAHLGLGQMDEAEHSFRRAAELDPRSASAFVGLARVTKVRGEKAKADAALKNALKLAPKDPDVLMLKGDLAFGRGDYGQAVEAYQDLVNVRRFNPFHRLRLARAEIAVGKIDDAEANLDKTLKVLPKQPVALFLKALAAFQAKDYKTADIRTKEVLAIAPNHLPSQLLAGAANFGLHQFEQASRYLKGYLADAPANDLARRLYGAALVNLGRGKEAERALQPLLSRSGNDALLLTMIGTAALQNRDLETGRVYFEKAVKANPKDAKTRTQLGTVQIGLGNLQRGVEELEKAIELDPKSDRAVFELFMARMRAKQYDQAVGVAKRVQQSRPDSPVGYTMAGTALFAKDDIAAAREAFGKALEVRPGVSDASMDLATLEFRSGDIDKARKVLNEALTHNPKNVQVLLHLATLEAKAGDWETARRWAERAVDVAPKDVEPAVVLAQLYLRAGSPIRALGAAQGLLQKHPGNPALLKVVGQAQLKAGQADDAARTLRLLVTAKPNSADAHFLLAMAYRALKDWPQHKRELERASALQPENAAIRAQLGTVEVGLGNLEEGINELEKAVELDPKSDRAMFDLFAARMRARQYDQALGIAQRMQQKEPKNSLGFIMAGRVFAAKGALAEAREAYGRALVIRPGDPNASIYLAALAIKEKHTDQARAILEDALKHDPKNIQIMLHLASLEGRLGKWEDAQSWAEKAVEADPKAVEPAIVLARLYLRSKQLVKAINTAQGALHAHPNDANLLKVLGQAQLTAERPEDAVATFRSLVDAEPKSLEAHYLLAGAYRQSNDRARYEDELKTIIGMDASQIGAKIDLASLLGREGRLEPAIKLLDELKAAAPENPAVIELDGDIALLQNRVADAITRYKTAAGKEPSSRLTLKLARLQQRAGDQANGLATLEKWLEQHPDDVAVRMMIGGFYLSMDRLEAARSSYAAAVEAHPDSWAARNQLAWTLRRMGNLKAALPHAERAVALSNNSPEALDTEGVILLEMGEPQRAAKLLRRASEGLGDNLEVQHHLARALAMGGNKDEARKILRQVLSEKVKFPDRKKAEILLKELGG